jgi:membrane protein required for colicin V production
MNMFDVIFLIFVLFFGIKGFLNGIIREMADFIGLILGFGLGILYYQPLGQLIASEIEGITPSFAYTFSLAIIVIGIWSISHLLGFLFTRKLSVGGAVVVRITGVVISILKFMFITAVIVYLFVAIVPERQVINQFFGNSKAFQMEEWLGRNLLSHVSRDHLKRFFNLRLDNLPVSPILPPSKEQKKGKE